MKRLILFLSVLFCFIHMDAQDNPCNTKGVPYSSFPQDTTIKLPSGTTITFNRCEFFDMRDCLEIVEITDTAGLSGNGLNMYDINGNALITCGMVKIDLKGCSKICFDVPVKIKMRIRFQDCSGNQNAIPNIFIGNNGTWQRDESNNSKITTENNERFLEFTSKCPVFINCDVPKKGRLVKFIASKGQKIGQLRLGTNCPLFYFDEKLPEPKRRLRMRLLCISPESTRVEAILRGHNDEQTSTGSKKLSELKHADAKVYCKKGKRSFFKSLFGWLKPSQGNFHKKYYL